MAYYAEYKTRQVKRMKTRQYSEHKTVDLNTCNAHKSFHYMIKTVMDVLILSKYGLIFTQLDSTRIDLGSASVNTVKFSKYQNIN